MAILLRVVVNKFSIFFLSLLLFSFAITTQSSDDCVYTIYTRTGSVINGGTDSNISLTLYDARGDSIAIPNLKTWGLMKPDHDYFERGNLDIFSGMGNCLKAPICAMNLTSDGSGVHHGWYCNYVEVTSTGPHIPCAQQLFRVEQWLALDTSPHTLTLTRDNCPKVKLMDM